MRNRYRAHPSKIDFFEERQISAPGAIGSNNRASRPFTPCDAQVAKTRNKAAQIKLKHQSVLDDKREIPAWIDDAIRKAVHPNPYKRYEELSEFLYDLRHPNKSFLNKTRPPLMERNPVLFWKGDSLILAVIVAILSIK